MIERAEKRGKLDAAGDARLIIRRDDLILTCRRRVPWRMRSIWVPGSKRWCRSCSGRVGSGRFTSRDEVLREGVRLLSEREARLARLDAAIERGLADAEAGRVHDIDEVRAEMRQRYRIEADVS